MVKIRLRRMGAKKNPYYRIVVSDSRRARDGRFIEEIGTYDPLAEPAQIKVDAERAKYWLGVGAQPTDTVRALLKKAEAAQKKAETVKPAEAVEEAVGGGVPDAPEKVEE